MLLFKKKFLPAIRRGEKTQTIRLWKHRRLKAGQRSYIPGVGPIRVTAVDQIDLGQLGEEDARADGFNWDLTNDGVGNPKNTKSMLLAHRTPPAMVTGVRPDAESAVRAGIEHILFADQPTRHATAIDEYLKSLKPAASPYLTEGRLSPAARRGKELFESDEVGCFECHPAPWYTDLLKHDVGTRGPYDQRAQFDTPALIEVWRTAPYLHDGRYTTIRQLIAEGRGRQEIAEELIISPKTVPHPS